MPSPAQDAPELDDRIEALDAHISRRAPRPDLPLDLRGTALQVKVWRFLLSVREGDVISYAAVSRIMMESEIDDELTSLRSSRPQSSVRRLAGY